MVLDAIIDILSYVYIRSESHGWEKCIQDLEISCRNVTNDISGGRHLSSIELKGNEIVCVVKRSSNWGYPFPQCIGYGGQSGGCKQWAYTSWRRGSEISDWRSLQPCTSWWGAWLAPPSSVWNWYLQKLVFQVHQKACNDFCKAQVCSCVCLLINLPGDNEWNFVLTKIPTPAQNSSPNYRSYLILPEQKFNYLLHRLVTTSCAFSNLHLSWSKNELPWR